MEFNWRMVEAQAVQGPGFAIDQHSAQSFQKGDITIIVIGILCKPNRDILQLLLSCEKLEQILGVANLSTTPKLNPLHLLIVCVEHSQDVIGKLGSDLDIAE